MKRTLSLEGVTVPNDATEFDQALYDVGREIIQEELSYENFMKVVQLLKAEVKDGLNSVAENFETMDVKIGQEKLLSILSISTGVGESVLKALKASEVKQLAADFFFLNAELRDELSSLCMIAAFSKMGTELKNIENLLKASPPNSSEAQKKI